MNAPTYAVPCRDDLLARTRELVSSLEAGDDAGFEARFAKLFGVIFGVRPQLLQTPAHVSTTATANWGLTPNLFVSVARLTRELHDAVRELRIDDRLASLAGNEIPDACSRLDYVIQVTEEAAHRTLDLVDQSRALTQQIETSVRDLGQVCERAQACAGSPYTLSNLMVSVDELGSQIVTANEQLRSKLSQLAQAQEYQDLAGQVIKRVTQLVRSVERALIDLLRASGTHPGNRAATEAPASGLHGPAIAGVTPAAVSQDDADSLLADLGF